MPQEPRFSALRINELQLYINLGCSPEERANPQEIRVSVELRFAAPLLGATTDRLDDTFCYKKLTDRIRNRLAGREYNLIEKVGADVYAVIRELAGEQGQVYVIIHKVNPPIVGLMSGTHYSCGDFHS